MTLFSDLLCLALLLVPAWLLARLLAAPMGDAAGAPGSGRVYAGEPAPTPTDGASRSLEARGTAHGGSEVLLEEGVLLPG